MHDPYFLSPGKNNNPALHRTQMGLISIYKIINVYPESANYSFVSEKKKKIIKFRSGLIEW